MVSYLYKTGIKYTHDTDTGMMRMKSTQCPAGFYGKSNFLGRHTKELLRIHNDYCSGDSPMA